LKAEMRGITACMVPQNGFFLHFKCTKIRFWIEIYTLDLDG